MTSIPHQPSFFRLAVFASGGGSNAQKLIDYFKNAPLARVTVIGCNKAGAGVLDIAEREGIPSFIIEREAFFRGDAYVPFLQEVGIDFIVLAGFLWKVPQALLDAYPKKIVNIHPALLPKYGGKGMYGQAVHEAVRAASERETGITIHYVDDQYDHGAPIFQARCAVAPADDAATIARNVLQLEHYHYPRVIESLLTEMQVNATN